MYAGLISGECALETQASGLASESTESIEFLSFFSADVIVASVFAVYSLWRIFIRPSKNN